MDVGRYDSINLDLTAVPFTRDGRSSGMVVDLGAGNDVAYSATQGFSDVSLKLTAGDGNDKIHMTCTTCSRSAIRPGTKWGIESVCNSSV